MSGDHKTRSRSLSPGSGSCRRRYDWNTIHFYPDIHQPSENASRLFSSSGERDAIETVTSHDDSQDDDSDDYQSSDDAAEWCYSPSDDDECVKSTHHDDVTENVAKEKTTRDVRKRVKWLDQQKQEDSAEEIAEENQAERVNSSSSSSSSRWPRKEQNNSCLRRHPVVKYETNVDSESSSSEDDDDDDDDDGHLPGEKSSNGDSNGAHLLYIDESDEEDTQQQQQQQPLSSSAEAEEISRSTENERGEEKKKVEGPRYLETHLDDDTWPQVDYDGAMDAVFKAIASSKEEEEEEEEEQIITLKSILRAKHTSHPPPRDNVYAPSRDRSRVKAAGNLEKLENADFSPIVENERLVDWSFAERPPRSTQPHSLWRPTAAEEKEEEAKGGKEGQHRQPSAVAAVDGGGGDDDAMSRMREQRNRRRFVFDYRRTLIDGKMAADNSSSSDGASDALTLEEFELCLDIRKDEHPPQEQQQQQPEVGSHISETSVPISKPETNISNFYKRTDDVTMASSAQEDPEILWLFDSAQRPRTQDTGGRSIADGSTSRRPRSADSANTQYPRIMLEENSFEWHDGRRNVCDRFSAEYFQLPSTVTRQQYRWSTCIREPEARLLIDDFQPNDVTSLSRRDLPMTSRYPAMYKMKKFPLYRKSSLDDDSTTEKKRKERTAAAAAAGERSFTVIGQPRSRKPLQLGGEVDSATPGYALAAAAAHRALGTIHEGGSYRASDRRPQPSFIQQTHCHEDCSPQNDARKYRYLRERVLTSVAPPTPEDSLPPLSRSAVGYQSLQNLDDMLTGRKQLDRSHRQQSPSNQTTTTTMTSSTQSLPHNLLLLPLLPHPSDQSPNTDRRRFFSASDRSMTTSSGPRNSASIEAEKEQERDLPLAAGNYFYGGGGGGGGGGGDTVSVCSDSGFSRSIQPNRFRPNTQQTKTPRIIKARNQLKALHKGKVSEEHHQLIKSSEV